MITVDLIYVVTTPQIAKIFRSQLYTNIIIS